jgi:S1-C subfamily serine protease
VPSRLRKDTLGPLIFLWLIASSAVASGQTAGSRLIPDDNLSYPVLIRIGTSAGSGFYLTTARDVFLVTATHVLFEPDRRTLLGTQAEAMSYASDPKERTQAVFRLDMQALSDSGNIKIDNLHDVAVVRVARVTGEGLAMRSLPLPGVMMRTVPKSGYVTAGTHSVKRFADVLVSNEVIVFGYPSSLGVTNIPQLDYFRPLLRKGIVAGTNEALKSLVLDCAVYPGNSGGPVVEVTRDSTGTRFKIIGVIIQYVPFAQGDATTVLSNSGYAIAAGMDAVLDLVETFK